MANLFPFPDHDFLVDEARRLTRPWHDWFLALLGVVNKGPLRIVTVTLTGQQAAISATDMTDGAIAAGLYRITYYARITQAATVSSSLRVFVGWTDGGVSPSASGVAITGNTTTTTQTGTLLIRADASSAVNYQTTYASVGATPMQYRLDITLERVDA